MKKNLLLAVLFVLIATSGFAQTDKFWSANTQSRNSITTYKAVARQTYPKAFKLFNLNIEPLRQELFKVVDNKIKHSTVISLPNADGQLEEFEVFEASNFEPALQAKFPEIRAFSGKGITDQTAILKLSISPQGIQTMIFRSESKTEFIEVYSNDRTVYSVFRSQREKGNIPWVCSTPDQQLATSLDKVVTTSNITGSSTGELKTLRLAQSCNGEYANYFGATSSAQVALVLAGFNATLTRCNGCYEKDLGVHLNLIANTTAVIYYDPATDPYTAMGAWNGQLMNTLHNIIGDANFDIGHMFGASGGGGNAGCIGCVCSNVLATPGGGGAENSYKGAGITSPGTGGPEGDNFDIDYVAHEMGHQMGGNHTFSFATEGTGVNKEVGSGITIMGYAGITNQDVAPHSIDIFHQASIMQIQANLATKTCPVTTNISANNATPVVAPVSNYTIPISTPFALTGSATDANAADVLTYCWEQNDNTTTTGNASVASPTKLTGPNWLSFSPTISPTRLLPKLSTILAGLFITPVIPGGDPIANIEALSSVSRTLNFRLTVRDNSPYSSTAPIKVGQTSFTDMVVTVTNTSGPFKVTVANTAGTTYPGGSSQNITWDVAGTTGAPVSCANVKISMSTDGGVTFPTVLAASTANDGSESVTIPGTSTTTARIKIESIGNIFFDINDANFSVTGSCPAPGITAQPANVITCPGTNAVFTVTSNATSFQWQVSTDGIVWNNVASAGNAATYTVTGVTTAMNNNRYRVITTNACGSTNSDPATLTVNTAPSITAQPSPASICATFNTSFTAASAGTGVGNQWQVSTDNGATWTNISNGGVYSGATTGTLTITGATIGMNGYCYRMVASGTCTPAANSNSACLTVIVPASVTNHPANASICSGGTITFSVTGNNTTVYKWQESIDGGTTWTNLTNTAPYSGVNTGTLTITNVPANFATPVRRYRALLSNASCTVDIASNAAILTIIPKPSAVVTANPSNSIFFNQTTTLNAAITNGNANTIITWYYNGAVLPGVTGTSYVVDVDHLGIYQVRVSDPTGTCFSFSNEDTVVAEPNNRLFITPNPNRGMFEVRYYSNAHNFGFNRTVTIYDSKGARIFSQPIPVNAPYGALKVDISKRGKGIYFLVLGDYKGKVLAQGKVIVQ